MTEGQHSLLDIPALGAENTTITLSLGAASAVSPQKLSSEKEAMEVASQLALTDSSDNTSSGLETEFEAEQAATETGLKGRIFESYTKKKLEVMSCGS